MPIMTKRPVEVKQVKLAKNGEDLERWLRKSFRALREVERIWKQRKRLLKPAPVAAEALPVGKPLTSQQVAEVAAVLDDDLPDWLDRRTSKEGRAKDEVAKQAIQEEQAERKRNKSRVRVEKLKAKQAGETRKMPLSGKDALAAIRATK